MTSRAAAGVLTAFHDSMEDVMRRQVRSNFRLSMCGMDGTAEVVLQHTAIDAVPWNGMHRPDLKRCNFACQTKLRAFTPCPALACEHPLFVPVPRADTLHSTFTGYLRS